MNMEALVALIQLYFGVMAGIIVIILMTVFVKWLDRLGGKKNVYRISSFFRFSGEGLDVPISQLR